MYKKFTITVILSILLISILTSPLSVANTNVENGNVLSEIFDSEITIVKDKDIYRPVDSSDLEKIKITLGFKLNIGSFAKQLLINRRIGRLILFGPQYIFKFLVALPKANISLSIEDIPDWCNAALDNYNFEFGYNNDGVNEETTLTLTFNESLPALEQANIIVRASYGGLWTIKPATNSTNISILTKYKSKIEWVAEKDHTIPPLKNTTVPINITNNGNGDTIVNIELMDIPKNWNVSLNQDNITIPVENNNNLKQINLVVKPPKDFKNETINLKLITSSVPKEDVDSEYHKGETITFSLAFKNDGSLKDEEELPLTEIAVILVIIIILLFIVMFLLKRKK